MARKNSIKLFVGAGLMFAAGSAFAADQVSQTFGADASAEISSFTGTAGVWVGDGALATEANPTLPAIGRPIDDTAGVVLSVEGDVSCTNVTGSTANQYETEFLINIPEPSDDLLAENATLNPAAQIALAAGSNIVDGASVPLLVYCKPNGSDSATWTNTTVAVSTGEWHRVTLAFDYGAKRCRVSLDGVPVVSDAGYLSTNDNTSTAGSWYAMAGTPAANQVKSLSFLGVAKLDDVLISDTALASYAMAGGNSTTNIEVGTSTMAVTYSELNKWGVSPETAKTTSIDNSGLKVTQKLECLLEPDSGTAFAATDMTLAPGANGALTATVAVPCERSDAGTYTYTVVMNDGTSDTVLEATPTAPAAGSRQLTFTIPASAASVLKFTIKVVRTAN